MEGIRVRAFDPGFERGDCAYHALRVGRDGRVYFAVSTHHANTHARLFGFDPAVGRLAFVHDLGELADQDSRDLPQAKVHVPLVEVDGRIMFATSVGAPENGRRYPGFRILELDTRTDACTTLARGPVGEGLITAIPECPTTTYTGLTYPGNRLVRYDRDARAVHVSGRPCRDWPVGGRLRLSFVFPVCRALAVDTSGAVYGSCADGSIWRAESHGPPRRLSGAFVGNGSGDRARGRRRGFWRTVVRGPAGDAFYGIDANTETLFRFEPARQLVETVGSLATGAGARADRRPAGATLALAFGDRSTLYYVAAGRPVSQEGRHNVRFGAWLTSYALDTGNYRDHGPLETDDGERVLHAESLTSDSDGNLYAVAWVDVADPHARRHYEQLRKGGSAPLLRGEIYRMMLIRIDAETLSRRVS